MITYIKILKSCIMCVVPENNSNSSKLLQQTMEIGINILIACKTNTCKESVTVLFCFKLL